MALSSIKQYSQLLTPPSEREDVKTFVKEYDDKLIKEIVLRELRRGGQLFYIHNNIASIEDKKRELLEILPNLKVTVLHSKIPPATTEKEMIKFEEKEYDLLLSTSIVESGIHIPNVNTIIIENADRFGMADLHQLRGRVGRSSKEGYCYMIVKNKDEITDDAKKRLLALESNSYLGSGAVLAYHDLEIRGGGNLIGEAQSGHIKGIGYNLYLKMLEDTINTLLNKTEEKEKVSVEVKLAISAYINSQTITEDRIRLELYRRLSLSQTPKEVYEIEEEMIDRFGKLDTFTKQFLELLVIKILAKQKGITQVMSYEQNITFTYHDGKKEYLKSPSKDDDDIIATTLKYLRD
jgi:transcription-repair coupling factor (superfamily II helicase)